MTDELTEVGADGIRRIEELEAEIDMLKNAGIIEVAVRNPSVSEYMNHWEARAERAEAKLAKAVEALEECVEEIDAYICIQYPWDHPVYARYRQEGYETSPARVALAELKGGSQ